MSGLGDLAPVEILQVQANQANAAVAFLARLASTGARTPRSVVEAWQRDWNTRRDSVMQALRQAGGTGGTNLANAIQTQGLLVVDGYWGRNTAFTSVVMVGTSAPPPRLADVPAWWRTNGAALAARRDAINAAFTAARARPEAPPPPPPPPPPPATPPPEPTRPAPPPASADLPYDTTTPATPAPSGSTPAPWSPGGGSSTSSSSSGGARSTAVAVMLGFGLVAAVGLAMSMKTSKVPSRAAGVRTGRGGRKLVPVSMNGHRGGVRGLRGCTGLGCPGDAVVVGPKGKHERAYGRGVSVGLGAAWQQGDGRAAYARGVMPVDKNPVSYEVVLVTRRGTSESDKFTSVSDAMAFLGTAERTGNYRHGELVERRAGGRKTIRSFKGRG